MPQDIMHRLLRLLMLLSGKRKYSLLELAELCSVSERTIYRSLTTIEDAGFILEREGLYRLKTEEGNGKSLKGLLHFSDEDAYIFCQALEQLEGARDVQQRLFSKLHALYDFRALTRNRHSNSLEIIGILREAMDLSQQVLLQAYRSSNSETISNRYVEPFNFTADYHAVWCYDTVSNQSKQFRISRMKGVELIGRPWRFAALHQVPFTDVFRMASSEPLETVTVILSLKAYNLLIEEYPLSADYIRTESNRYILDVPVADFNGIGRFVLGLPGEATVRGPDRFKFFLEKQKKKKLTDSRWQQIPRDCSIRKNEKVPLLVRLNLAICINYFNSLMGYAKIIHKLLKLKYLS